MKWDVVGSRCVTEMYFTKVTSLLFFDNTLIEGPRHVPVFSDLGSLDV